MCDILLEKTKGRGRKVKQERVFIQKQPSEGFFKRGVMRNYAGSQENICNGISFWCFPVNFAKFSRTPFLQNSSERLLLIIAVSIVAK